MVASGILYRYCFTAVLIMAFASGSVGATLLSAQAGPSGATASLPGEGDEDWVPLGTKLHGGFGSYVALGVHVGLDARAWFNVPMRVLSVSVGIGSKTPCPCVADGLQLSTGASVGRGLLHMEAAPAPADVFAVVIFREPRSGRRLRYTIPSSARTLLDTWNQLPAHQRLGAFRSVSSAELYVKDELPPS